MANNLIQIKRSATTATPGSLNAGELAFSNVTGGSGVLFIGSTDGGTVVPIGGVRNPGTLTANQALVANSTSGIDKVITANLAANSVWANGSSGTSGQVLTSNGTVVYWSTPSAGVAGADTQVQFNDGGNLAGDSGLTYNKTTDTLTSGNVVVSGTTSSSNTTTGALTVSGGVGINGRLNVTDVAIGNDSVYASVNNTVISTNNLFATGTVNGSILSVGSSVIGNSSGVFTTGSVNGSVIGVGAQFSVNTTQVSISQGMKLSANGSLGSANQVLRSDGAGTAYWADDTGDISAVTAGNGLTGGGSSGDVTLNVGAGNGISVSSDAVAVSLGSNSGLVANASGLFVASGNGISTDSSSLYVLGGSTLTVNTVGVHVNTDLSITSLQLSKDLTVNGNTKLGDSSSDVISMTASVNTNIMPSANVTYDIGSNSMRWREIHASNVHSVTGYFDGNVQVGGDIIVTGNLVTQNVQSVIISDPLIYLAGNNYVSDLVDIGFTGNYYDGSTQRHTGVIRHAATDEYYIFKNLTQELDGNNVVNINDATFRLADVNAWLKSGALISNSTAVTITANSTVNVNFTANSLTLTTALAATSGGTGQNTYTTGDLLYASTSSALSKLNVGSNGQVLQITNNLPAYGSLDGGTF